MRCKTYNVNLNENEENAQSTEFFMNTFFGRQLTKFFIATVHITFIWLYNHKNILITITWIYEFLVK